MLSAKDRLSTANKRAVVSRFVWWARAAFSAISFQVFQIGPAQNFADHGLVSRPRRAGILPQALHLVQGLRVYAWLVNAGGGPGRNCAALFSTKGVTLPQLVKTGAANFGGVRLVVARLVARHKG